MSINRGDVVIVQFPFASGTGMKVRPALVVQSNRNNGRLANVIVVAITTTTHRSHETTQFLIELKSARAHRNIPSIIFLNVS